MAKKKILVVEDNEKNMRLMKMALRAKGYHTIEANDGEQGLEMTFQEKPDLIVMDMQLPKMNGLEVTRHVKEKLDFEHIPIIALTAYAMEGDREKFLQSGCDDYLAKPIDIREFLNMVERMIS